MKKEEIISRITQGGIVPVVRAETPEIAEKIALACVEGGIQTIEVTFTVPHAEKVIAALCEKFNDGSLLVGAGTVLDVATARLALENGAKFIVSPGFDLDVAHLCTHHQIPYLAGALTPTEIYNAMKNGVEIVKIFPGSAFGPCYIKAIKGPYPNGHFMPTGGVSLDNVEEWIHNGAVAVGIGSELTAPAKKGDFAGVTALAKQFVLKVQAARGGK